ncbi:MAG: hypothetical protein ACP5RC_03650, partial [Halothiobacillaceae bacterium]
MITEASLILCHLQEELGAWYVAPGAVPKRLPVEGEQHPSANSIPLLESALRDIASRCRAEHPWQWVHWVADEPGRVLLAQIMPQMLALLGAQQNAHWQVQAWEICASHAGLATENAWSQDRQIERELIPWLIHRSDSEELARAKARIEHERLQAVEDFEAERARLHAEIDHLRRQRDALRRADLERLASYLPAIYQRFFEHVSPVDLALQCGHIVPPA